MNKSLLVFSVLLVTEHKNQKFYVCVEILGLSGSHVPVYFKASTNSVCLSRPLKHLQVRVLFAYICKLNIVAVVTYIICPCYIVMLSVTYVHINWAD